MSCDRTTDADEGRPTTRKRTRENRKSEEAESNKRIRLDDISPESESKEPAPGVSGFSVNAIDANVWNAIFWFLPPGVAHSLSSISRAWQSAYRSPAFWRDRRIILGCPSVVLKLDAVIRRNLHCVRIAPADDADSRDEFSKSIPSDSFENLAELTVPTFLSKSDMDFLAKRSTTLRALHVLAHSNRDPSACTCYSYTPGLAALTELRTLTIDVLDDREVSDVAKCTRLERLTARALNTHVSEDAVGRVLVPSCTNLKTLHLRATWFDPSNLSALQSLEALHVVVNPVPNAIDIMMEAQKCPELKKLEIRLEENVDEDNDETTEYCGRLPDDLRFGANLRILRIDTNMAAEGDSGYEPADDILFRAIRQCPNLVELVVLTTVSRITDAGIEACWVAMPLASTHLQHLCIGSNFASSDSIYRISKMFPELSSFMLRDCDDDIDRGWQGALYALKNAKCLRGLEWPDVAFPKLNVFKDFLKTCKPANLAVFKVIWTGRATPYGGDLRSFIVAAKTHGVKLC